MVNEAAPGGLHLSRISKLFVDRDEVTVEEALVRRQSQPVTLICGSDVAMSSTLQLAVLTAAHLAARCFRGAVRVVADDRLAAAPLRLWPSLSLTFGRALADIVGVSGVTTDLGAGAGAVLFGNAVGGPRTLRVTFDGWIAAVGPAETVDRLAEREFCTLSGVLAGALAISELFNSAAAVSIQASRRPIALSLWRPDVDARDAAAQGIPIQFLPKELWALGLGHLGNAYLWALAALPFRDRSEVEIFLNDFDRVESENTETGVLFTAADQGRYKTRVCCAWLEERGFTTRLVERRFDHQFRRGPGEPGLALCGFDSNHARRALATAEFIRVVDSGLGGTPDNFDAISLHTLPSSRPALELWPDPSPEERDADIKRRTRVAQDSAAYSDLGGNECGRFDLAGKAVAVPFVGMTAASFVLAEVLRLFHDGPAYSDFKLRLATPSELTARRMSAYTVHDMAALRYVEAVPQHEV